MTATTTATTATARKATNADVEACMGKAKAIALRFVARHPSCARHREDIIGEAYLMLVETRDRFDSALGDSFERFALKSVRKALVKYFEREIAPLDIGIATPDGGDSPPRSFSFRSNVLGGEFDVRDKSDTDPTSGVESREYAGFCLAMLSACEREIVVRRLVFDEASEDIANDFDFTPRRVRQITDEALGKMRAAAEAGE